MPLGAVRANLRDAYQEIEGCCETGDVTNEGQLRGIARQLRYLAEGGQADPEALAFPDPGALETMGDQLADVIDTVQGDAETRLRRARDNILLAVAKLDDSLENQRNP